MNPSIPKNLPYKTCKPVQPERNSLYWHYSVPPLEEEGAECSTCSLSVLIKPSLMEIVETLNPGQPPLPEWVYNGAILGGPRHPPPLGNDPKESIVGACMT